MSRPNYSMQEEADFCGAAVCQMILSYVGKPYRSQRDIAETVGIFEKRSEHGKGYTCKRGIRRLLEQEGVDYEEFAGEGTNVKHGNAQLLENPLEKLVSELQQGNIAIVNISRPGAQYVLAYAVADGELVYHDPSRKADKTVGFSALKDQWISANKDWIKWFMVIRDQKDS
jgi:hypothetical protein